MVAVVACCRGEIVPRFWLVPVTVCGLLTANLSFLIRSICAERRMGTTTHNSPVTLTVFGHWFFAGLPPPALGKWLHLRWPSGAAAKTGVADG
jgi:hypothetical protein